MFRVTAIAVLLSAFAPGVARGAEWLRPVSGRIVRSFSVTPGSPYAAGQRRGVVIAAGAGATVRSACTGRVAFAGEVAGSGPTLSVQCGALRATYQGLGSIAVQRGDPIVRGAPVATVGVEGGLRLGARTGARSYVDPARLIGDDPLPLPLLGPAPRAAPQRPARRRPRPPRPTVLPSPAALPAAQRAARAPILAWFALAVLACSLPGGALLERRRRRARAERVAARTEAARG